MPDKQMEGDNQRRRTLAREAREMRRRPSEAGVTLGASKQFEHTERKRREGPPAAGRHKPGPDGGDLPTRPPPGVEWPLSDPHEVRAAPPEVAGLIRYRDLIEEVRRRTGLDFDQARLATEATVTVLARALDEADRQRLLDEVPNELHDDQAVSARSRPNDLSSFLDEVARIAHRPLEQARYQAQAVFDALADQDVTLIESLHLPPAIKELTEPPPTGGGVVGSTGHTAPLTDGELRAALAGLPYWSGSDRGLCRSIKLPRDNLDRVLQRLDRLRVEYGRGPHIGRQDEENATLIVRTGKADAVTALDIDLAHRVDAAIDEAGAGLAAF